MNKIILIAVIAVIIVVLLGLYFIFLNSNQDASGLPNETGNQNPGTAKIFDVQGVKVEITKEGSGAAVKDADSVTINYVGTLADGTKFDSTIDTKRPYTFTLGRHSVPAGFELGVLGMKAGEKRKITVPSDLAYGKDGFITIPPNAILTYEIELLKINN